MKNHVEKALGLLIILLSMTLLISEIEIENNNIYSRATPISLNVICSGSLSGNKNVESDWYTFTLNNAGRVNIVFDSSAMQNNFNYYEVSVYSDADLSKQLSGYTIRGLTRETNLNTLGLPQGKYYVRVQSSSYWSDADYSFIVNYLP